MSREVLRSAIEQILHSYQRCGLKWFERGAMPELPPGLLESLDEFKSSQDDYLPESNSAISLSESSRTSTLQRNASTESHGRDRVGSVDRTHSQELIRDRATTPASAKPRPLDPAGHSGDGPVILSPEAGHGDPWPELNLDEAGRAEVLDSISQRVAGCRLCTELCEYRQQTVFGTGPVSPAVCFMGEAPGADEDRTGQPFVGAAGQLLTKIIAATQLRREDVFILNALKCRPPNNRTPTDSEIANCRPYLLAQLETLQPKFIVCLGAVAARSLLNCTTSIGRLRGRIYQFRGARVIVTYHPSYLLRQEQAKRLVWEDMQMLMRELGIPVTKKS